MSVPQNEWHSDNRVGVPLRLMGGVHGKLVHSRRVKTLANLFARLIPQDHMLLDIGCGDGLVDSMILDQRPDLHISGVDVLLRQGSAIPVKAFNGETIPYPDGSFDSVMFCDVLHHTESPEVLLREAVRVARHCVIIKDHLVQGLLARPTLRFMDFIGNSPHAVVLPYNYLAPKDWQRLFNECGLSPRNEITRLGLYPWFAELWFGRGLHFLGLYDICGQADTDGTHDSPGIPQ